MKRVLLAVITALLASLPLISEAKSESADTQMQMIASSQRQENFITRFVQQAKAKDTASIMQEIDPLVLQASGSETIDNWLQQQIFPFFAQYSKLHNFRNISIARLPDGRAGLWHYTYIIDSQGKAHPFRIALTDTPEGPRILSVVVNQCVPDRHMDCE